MESKLGAARATRPEWADLPRGERGRIHMAGCRVGKLLVLDIFIPSPTGTKWVCRCDCGGEIIVRGSALRTRARMSCGCDADWSGRPGYDHIKALHANSKARLFRAEGICTEADIARIRDGQSDLCRYCRTPVNGGGHLDHIVSFARGGSNWPSNIQITCAPCNLAKGVQPHEDFERRFSKCPDIYPENTAKRTEMSPVCAA